MTNASTTNHQPYKFPGFSTPFYTQVPDIVFDELLPILSGAELKVLLYIIRRTFGFKKNRDNISLSQMVSGIKTRDGQIIDGGTGLGKSSVARALITLERKNIVIRKRRTTNRSGYEATTYALNVREQRPEKEVEKPAAKTPDRPLSQNRTSPPLSQNETSLVPKSDTQETVIQETEQQHVVAALTNAGISLRTAEKLVGEYQSEYLMQKVSFLEFLQAGQETRIKRPAGWLRRAIEQDFAAPDGYKPPEALAEEQRQIEVAQKKAEERKRNIEQTFQKAEREKAEIERQKARLTQRKLEELRAEHQTSKAEIEAWKGVKEQLEKAYPGSLQVKAAIDQSHLLSVRDGVALFACTNKFAADWLEVKLDILVRSQLKGYGLETKRVECLVINANGEGV